MLVTVTALCCSATARTRGRGSPGRSRRSPSGRSTARRASRRRAAPAHAQRQPARSPLRSTRRPRSRSPYGAEVLLPALRDLRRREADEEHGRRRPRARGELHVHLVRQPVPLAEVARRAGGDDVLPGGVAALRARDHVVERQPPAARAAVDAAPAVTGEERAAGDLPLHHPRNADVVHEPDDVWPLERVRGRAKWSVELLDHLCLALEDEHVGAAQRAHVERLVTRIENENLLHLRGNVPAADDGVRETQHSGTAVSGPSRARRPPAPRARGRPRPGRAPAPSCRSARSRGPGSRSRRRRCGPSRAARATPTGGRPCPRRRRSGRSTVFVTVPSTRRSTRASPAATSSTARCRSSIRALERDREVDEIPPAAAEQRRCASRTRLHPHPRPPGEAERRPRRPRLRRSRRRARARRARREASAASPSAVDRLTEREDDRVARLVVRRCCARPAPAARRPCTVVFWANGTWPRSPERDRLRLARVDQRRSSSSARSRPAASGSSASP